MTENIQQEDRLWSVYIHTSPSNKKYVGITSQNPPEKRWKNGYAYKNNEHFTSAIYLYGWDNIKHEIIASELTRTEAEKMEVELITKYNTTNKEYGYNKTTGGESGKQLSDETIMKMRKPHISMRGENHPNYGKPLSDETKEKLRQSHINISDETRKKMSESAKRRCNQEWSEKMKLSKTQESLRKIGDAHARRVVQLDDEWNHINTFTKIRIAAEEMDTSESNIAQSCKRYGEIRAKGFRWMYEEDYINIKLKEKES